MQHCVTFSEVATRLLYMTTSPSPTLLRRLAGVRASVHCLRPQLLALHHYWRRSQRGRKVPVVAKKLSHASLANTVLQRARDCRSRTVSNCAQLRIVRPAVLRKQHALADAALETIVSVGDNAVLCRTKKERTVMKEMG